MRSSSLGHAYRWTTGFRRTPAEARGHVALLDRLRCRVVAQDIEPDFIDPMASTSTY